MKAGKKIEFNQSRHFKFIRELGSGGAGVTNLFHDETMDTYFAIKKYLPVGQNVNYKEEFYQRFVREIKILFKVPHPNIVRIYNYYLYPEYQLGYLQMEYIEGITIDKYIQNNEANIEKIFRSTIGAFVFLENNNILHRDIRPSNIMIDNTGEVKIIDFGFGKELDDSEDENSVLLNWPATEFPIEVLQDENYTQQSEIYFLGYLFRKLLSNDDVESFQFNNVLKKMCESDPKNRYESFREVSADIAKGILLNLSFTSNEKLIYTKFAEKLYNIITRFKNNYIPISDVTVIMSKIEQVLRSNSLETNVQNKESLINSFVENDYTYSGRIEVEVEIVRDFYKLLRDSEPEKKDVIIENLTTKLSNIIVYIEETDLSDEDLPF